MPDDPLIVFLPSGRRGRVSSGTPVLEAARRLGADIDSVCGGRGLCGRCQVTVGDGSFPKLGIYSRPDSLSPSAADETAYATRRGLPLDRRLACKAAVLADVVIDVPPESQIHRQVVRKEAGTRPVEADPMIRLHYVEVPPATLQDQISDVERVERALAAELRIAVPVRWTRTALSQLPRALRDGEWKVTAAIRDRREVAAIWPGLRETTYGLAVDVGTTTLAAHLCDLATGEVVAAAGMMNPQIRFGEDVMSRVTHLLMHPESGDHLTAAVREAVARLAGETAAQAGIELSDILEIAVVGNPIMHHLLVGLDPLQLGASPFPLVVDRALELPASELGWAAMPAAQAYVLPCIAGHVGADTAGMLLADAPPDDSPETVLLVDIGTNAEIVLARQGSLWACSSPTGPAFEGAQISAGQRAAPGAIERVRIDPATLVAKVKAIGCDLWSDEAGFAEAMGDKTITGICGSGIVEAVAEMFLAGILRPDGRIDGALAGRCGALRQEGKTWSYRLYGGPREVTVTQADVRAIQLAKAALYAGARLLMLRAGVASVDRVLLAGAFGSYIDPRHAMVLGMIPDCRLDHVTSVGNAAGTGARIALVSRKARRWIEARVRAVRKVETAAERDFQRLYLKAMAIPHAEDAFPAIGLGAGRASQASPAADAAGVQ